MLGAGGVSPGCQPAHGVPAFGSRAGRSQASHCPGPCAVFQVNRQVAQCNCAKRFQVEQISANRYRVSTTPCPRRDGTAAAWHVPARLDTWVHEQGHRAYPESPSALTPLCRGAGRDSPLGQS